MRDKSKTLLVDMGEFRPTNGVTRVLVTEERGKWAMEKIKLMSVYKKYDFIDFVIPNDIVAISSSFIRGLFSELLIKIGEEKFSEKIHFTSTHDYKIHEDIQDLFYTIRWEQKYAAKITTDYVFYTLFGILNFMAVPFVWLVFCRFYDFTTTMLLCTMYYVSAFGFTIMLLNYITNRSFFISIKKQIL